MLTPIVPMRCTVSQSQVVTVLDAMGGLLKSEDEQQAELQLSSAKDGHQLFRVTAMFSATMPLEVERIAKKYLRHPAVIKIGDEDTGKNKRIEQRVHFITEGQKKNKLVDELGGIKSGGGSGTRMVGANGSIIGDELSEAEEGILATSAYP